MKQSLVEKLIADRCISLNTTRIDDITETAVTLIKLSKDLIYRDLSRCDMGCVSHKFVTKLFATISSILSR